MKSNRGDGTLSTQGGLAPGKSITTHFGRCFDPISIAVRAVGMGCLYFVFIDTILILYQLTHPLNVAPGARPARVMRPVTRVYR